MVRVGDRWGKMERYCSTVQSPQRAVAPTEEADICETLFMLNFVFIVEHCTVKSASVYCLQRAVV
jgi:hypothetical protein